LNNSCGFSAILSDFLKNKISTEYREKLFYQIRKLMKIGVLSDIHGNHYALTEVLKAATHEKVDRLLVLGDIVGYYYHPNKLLEQLNDWDYLLIKGNHEDILLNIISGTIKESVIRAKYGSGHQKAIEQLSKTQLETLCNAPERRMLEIDNIKILMCHGSPWSTDYYLYPDTQKKVLDKCEQPEIDIVLTGHSHHAFFYKAGRSILINAGSVGQNRNTGGLASWALINTDNGSIQLKSTPYDVTQLIDEIERMDPDNIYLKYILTRNRK